MSKLSELIDKLCPNGVEYKKLGEICEVITGGEPPVNSVKGKSPSGNCIYPIYANGIGENALWGFSDKATVIRSAVTFSSIGTIGHPTIRNSGFTPIIRLKVIYPKNEKVLSLGFLKYALEVTEFKQQKSSLPNINASMVKGILIPLPPLEIQREVVEILDKFAQLTAQLTAELQKRKKQYEHYRDFLLEGEASDSSNSSGFRDSSDSRNSRTSRTSRTSSTARTTRWVRLGEICEMKRGRVISKDYLKENKGEYPVYSSQTLNEGIFGYISTYDFEGEYLTWTTDGANAGSVFYHNGKFSITNVCGLLKSKDDKLSIKYLFYWLKREARKYVS